MTLSPVTKILMTIKPETLAPFNKVTSLEFCHFTEYQPALYAGPEAGFPNVMALFDNNERLTPAILLTERPDLRLPVIIMGADEETVTHVKAGAAYVASNQIYWKLPTSAAHSWGDLSDEFVNLICHLSPKELCEQQVINMRIAAQEAVSNAVVHGNLEIGSMEAPPFNGDMGAYYDEVDKRLINPAHLSKSVELSARFIEDRIIMTVSDQGRGNQRMLPMNYDKDALSGRGTMLMIRCSDRLEVQQSPSKVTLEFLYEKK